MPSKSRQLRRKRKERHVGAQSGCEGSVGSLVESVGSIDDNVAPQNLVPSNFLLNISPPHKKTKMFDLSILGSATPIHSPTQHFQPPIPEQSNQKSPVSIDPSKFDTIDKQIVSRTSSVSDTLSSVNLNMPLPVVQNIDFNSINITFATAKNPNCQIWRKAGLNLYENDENSTGPRKIETYWNNLSLYLDDSFIYTFLCYIATISHRKTVVVDSLYTDMQNIQILIRTSIQTAAFNFDPNVPTEIILIPLIFQSPDHWALLIHDVCFGTFYIDSLQITTLNNPRIEHISNIINELTNVAHEFVPIQTIPPSEITLQTDGCSCGYFICLYAESYVMVNRSFVLPSLDIDFEKRRILWHINELYSNDDIEYHCRNSSLQINSSFSAANQTPSNSTRESSVISASSTTIKRRAGRPSKRRSGHSGPGRPKKSSCERTTTNHKFPSNDKTPRTSNIKLPLYTNESAVDDSCPVDGFGAFICATPVPDREPEVLISLMRRSARLSNQKQTQNVIESIDSPDQTISSDTLTKRCYKLHDGLPCADVRSNHSTVYYDSGNIGEQTCDYCNALLLNSEAEKKNGKISSPFCCHYGKIKLPLYNEHPPLLQEYLSCETAESKEFLKNQNVYNSLLAFASISVGFQESSLDGNVCFLLNGEFVRQISSMLPGKFAPSFSQLYILDPTSAIEHRTKNVSYGGDRVNPDTLKKLDLLIRNNHPVAKELLNFHSQYLKTLAEDGPDAVANFRLTLIEARDAPANIVDQSLHPRQTNMPDEGDTLFAVWTETEYPPFLKGVWITSNEGKLRKLMPCHPLTDSLCYPLLFPCGDDGFHPKILLNHSENVETMETDVVDADSDIDSDIDSSSVISDANSTCSKTSKRQFVSIRDYIRYRMAIRKNEKLHHIWSAGGALTQKFVLDYSSRIDAEIASFLRRPELNLRSTLPENILMWLSRNAGLNSTEELGSIVLFRKYQPGTRAYFQQKFYDATTIMARFKKPGYASFFLTFTTNPRWPEIARNFLHKDQRTIDRFDLICRIYEDKLRQLHYLIDKKNILGKMIGQESREFQKKYGGPHMHRIYHSNIIAIPENIENIIWAHIPPEPELSDKTIWANFIRQIRKLLPKYQMHDCGAHCLNSKGRCKKGFPKPFSKITILYDDKPAVYYRPSPQDGGETLSVSRGKARIIYDNSRISSYNPYILVRFETHHNIEFAYGQSTSLKYVLKYPFKGPSFSYIKSKENSGKINVDEPAFYAKMLYRSPPEAYSRIMSYKYALLSHTVISLSIHLPGQQKVYIKPGQQQAIVQQILSGDLPETPLTAYWTLWANDSDVKKILFERMPETYSFNKSTKSWKKRKLSMRPERIQNRKPIIGRIYPVSPRNPELFALYLLIKHFPGSDVHLKTIDSKVCETFLEAARLRGLIDNNDVWIHTLEEAAISLMPAQMRQLLANILIFGSTEKCIVDGSLLWTRFLQHFYDIRCKDSERPARIERALALLERLLVAQGRQCKDFGLPTPKVSIVNDPQRGLNEFFFPQNINDDEIDQTVDTKCYEKGKLNSGQKQFYSLISSIFTDPSSPKLYHLTGDGGSGKTYLLNYIIYHMRRAGKKVIPTASTGMASTRFYSGGTTVHSAFKFGIDIEPGKLPSIPLESFFGRRIIESEIIIVDEMTMVDKTLFDNVDALCRLMCSKYRHLPFGGKCVIISGDWKQSLPVVIESAGSAAQIATCIQSSHLYQLFQKCNLTESMRVNPNEKEFLKWLDNVGSGVNGETVSIPSSMLVHSREELIDWVFDKGFNIPSNQLLRRLLLATTNRIVDLNNSLILEKFKDDYVDYFSVDSPTEENPLAVNAADYDVTQLNLLNPLGMPHHHLKLKIGSIIVLLINLNTSKGLCNGTRLIVKKLSPNLIEAEAITGGASRSGIILGIPRYRSTFKDKRPGGVSFERFQFPVRIAFTMTIIKAQGQTCDRLGIDFTEEPFSHGQLYTALSRVTSSDGIKIFAPNKSLDENGNPKIRNIVAPGLQLD